MELRARLDAYAALLLRWNARINLIGPSTIASIWQRHIDDSLQLAPLCPAGAGGAADLGSGAGFPGLVLALATGRSFTLVEADRRKAAFLAEAVRVTGAPARVACARIADLAPLGATLITARALAPLPDLLALAVPHLAAGGVLLLPKGAQASAELTNARRGWHMRVDAFPSRTAREATILRLSELRRVEPSTPERHATS
ncbi:16S rRNA (guanine(527)-N(7))-methyltransferase RsmG [Acidisphaera rubrifaciens]|uniref:Ribosomal RNA small subunit methyltransferase G n=1 Tax=Acidisphaera rubrifaciens HS-AP3 TaxID=1231350 RepID=A0A0D6PAT1_9PROT|nr:16S rRNA (guanine(527)-N(7))-methyltransferase RsmG [Acidisphaera rubrifaciens]GAN78303.1 glucose inhibited division protein B methyltransferase GidB [Acidisphaera rubrifaciens HS-AP3]